MTNKQRLALLVPLAISLGGCHSEEPRERTGSETPSQDEVCPVPSEACLATCRDLHACTRETDRCLGLGSLSEDAFLCGFAEAGVAEPACGEQCPAQTFDGCLQACGAEPMLNAVVSLEDCETTVATLTSISRMFADACAGEPCPCGEGTNCGWWQTTTVPPFDPEQPASAAAPMLYDVAVSDEWALLGTLPNPFNAPAAELAHLYRRNRGGADWTKVQEFMASNLAGHDEIGRAVALAGDVAVVATRVADASLDASGVTYVFEPDPSGADGWVESRKLVASDAEGFGRAVDTSGAVIVVGAPADGASGSAHVFVRGEPGQEPWPEAARLLPPHKPSPARFGASVAVSGDVIVVGAPAGATGAPPAAAYVFSKDEGGVDNWGLTTKLSPSGSEAGTYFGAAVSIDGDVVAVGANGDDGAGVNSGAVYLFHRDEGGPDRWGQVQRIAPSNETPWRHVGWSVELSQGALLVGTYRDGIGEARLFLPSLDDRDMWQEQCALVPPSRDRAPSYGRLLSLDGRRAVVGEDANALFFEKVTADE
ncbi:MAG: FG-GAP repeat protein [Deltaproteobacteria bacterium]|jgi:hypothetical protein|nr:FG-GAP repeat protein [Deltaproteobacteria bacterium]MBW2533120.1 FG-GAP repeat protein [Deltaproteobacteria bacterium]